MVWEQTLLEKQAKVRERRVLRRWRNFFQAIMLRVQLREEYGDYD